MNDGLTALAEAESSVRDAMAHQHVPLTVVIPVYNEEASLSALFARLYPALDALGIGYEVILVNDGSKDGTLARISDMLGTTPHLAVVNLSRNFGHQLAATAGLDAARGEAGP